LAKLQRVRREKVAYAPIEVNRESLTIMGVTFPDIDSLELAASGIGTNMFEGFVPTPKHIEIMRDFMLDKITGKQALERAGIITS
jgi:putative transcriptional regulator